MFFGLTKIMATSVIVVAVIALAACGTSEPKDVSFDLTVKDRALTAASTTFVATQGDTVTLNLSPDEDAEFHVHGYELIHEVAAGETETVTFEADATGRFSIEMHVADVSEECTAEATNEALRLAVTPTEVAGHFVVTAQTENFDLTNGNHWHLFIDGEVQGMIFESTTPIELAEGEHEVMGVLTNADHCDLPVSDSVMVMGMATTDDHAMTEHEHGGDEIAVTLGAIEIRPR